MIECEMDVVILDVRITNEYKQGHIEGAIQIADTDIEKMAGEKLLNKDQEWLWIATAEDAANKQLNSY